MPELSWARTFPSAPTGTVTVLEAVPPALMLTLDVIGRGWPEGQTLRWVSWVASVTVTLRTAAAMLPDSGCLGSARPTGRTTEVGLPAWREPPARVSSSRNGSTAAYPEGAYSARTVRVTVFTAPFLSPRVNVTL